MVRDERRCHRKRPNPPRGQPCPAGQPPCRIARAPRMPGNCASLGTSRGRTAMARMPRSCAPAPGTFPHPECRPLTIPATAGPRVPYRGRGLPPPVPGPGGPRRTQSADGGPVRGTAVVRPSGLRSAVCGLPAAGRLVRTSAGGCGGSRAPAAGSPGRAPDPAGVPSRRPGGPVPGFGGPPGTLADIPRTRGRGPGAPSPPEAAQGARAPVAFGRRRAPAGRVRPGARPAGVQRLRPVSRCCLDAWLRTTL